MSPAKLLFFLNAFLLLGVNKSQAQVVAYKNQTLPVDRRVQDLLSRMTTLEKIHQLDMYWGKEISPMGKSHEAFIYSEDSVHKVLGTTSIGSIHDLYPVSASLPNRIQRYAVGNTRLGIPVMFIEEGLHGYSGKGSTSFPVPLHMASTWDTSLIYQIGRVIATESRAHGTHMILAPLLGLSRDPRWGRMEETFGEDTYLVSRMGVAMVEGLQGAGVNRSDAVISEPKHFAVHPIPEAGSNTGPVNIGIREIRSTFLPPFERAVKEGGALAIMAAYHEIDGIPCVDNKWLLTDLLRKEWGFKGFVLADLGAIRMSLETHQVASGRADALSQTLSAGLNMQFYDFGHAEFAQSVDSALQAGMLPASRLDSAVADVLRVKFLLGLFDHPYTDTTLIAKVIHSEAHQQLALKAAREGICLLKNNSSLLPLRGVKKIALIGTLAKSNYLGGYSNSEDTSISLLEGLKQRVGTAIRIEYASGINKENSKAEWQKTLDLVRNSDVAIVVLGEDGRQVGEGKDRADLELSTQQLRLVKAVYQTGKPVVVVLHNGRPLCINWIAGHIPSIVEGWFGGEKSGLALADVLLGNFNPTGKLPVTFPRSEGQIPFYYSHKPSSFHKYVDQESTPLFPFGHGLSYTTFSYSGLQLPPDPVNPAGEFEVRLSVTNTGNYYGEEVVQLYIRDKVSSVTTPVEALKGFNRVGLKPGETKEVVFRINVKDALSLWNKEMQHVVEAGEFHIMVGSSSEDVRLEGSMWVR